jgi:hypothetical protein
VLTVAGPAARADTPPAAQLTTVASPSVPVGGSITDTAVVIPATGAPAPTGSVTFSLYDVSDTKCTGTPVFTQTVPVALPTTSGAFTPTKAGTYHWIARYGGDAANGPVSGACADPGESVSVTALTPTVTTVASQSVALGGTIGDTAVISGGYKPTGTITFKLYGAADPTCAGPPVFTSTVPLGTPAVSGTYKPTAAGTYRFVATYNGDAANNPASSGCADPTEAVVVTSTAGTPPPAAQCDAAGMARAIVTALVDALTGAPGTAFHASCSAGVRIVVRAKEIRPGNRGFPRHDGFTTMGNTLTHTSPSGPISFSFNAQGTALRAYARSHGASLTGFVIVHVRPDRQLRSTEAIQILTFR